MKKEILFEAIGEIDDDLIEESEMIPAKKKKGKIIPFVSAAAAACFVLVLVGIGTMHYRGIGFDFTTGGFYTEVNETTALPEGAMDDTENAVEEAIPEEAPPQAEEERASVTEEIDGSVNSAPQSSYNVTYNHYDEVELLASDRLPSFNEELSADELTAILPTKELDGMDISGFADFSYGDAELCFVKLQVSTGLEEDINITISPYEGFGDCCVVVYPDAALSSINGKLFSVSSHYWNDEELYLWATTEINGTYFRFEYTVHPDDEEQAKKDFEAVLECFTHYPDDSPKLYRVKPEVIPEYINEELSHGEAMKNEAFGAYVPEKGPDGFGETFFNYHKWDNVHGLNAHWYRGLDSFDIYISEFSSADENRLVKVSDTEKYDLNLYPIPRSDSVPEELWEVVHDPIFEIEDLTLEAVKIRTYYIEDAGDTDGPRMDFSVKYGDVLVRVITKGVEPEWVFDCLKNLG